MKSQIKFEQITFKYITLCFSLFVISILFVIFIISDSSSYSCKQLFLVPNRVLLLCSILICVFLIFIKTKNKKRIRVNGEIFPFLIDASILLLIVQLFIAYHIYFYTNWDAGAIRVTVHDILYNQGVITDSGVFYQYSRYTNNINLTGLLFLIEKFFSNIGFFGYSGWLLCNIFLVNIAGFFTSLCVFKITKEKIYAIITWFIFVVLVALSPWISIPYSDTFSILFPILSFYLYISREPDKRNIARWFGIGFLCLLGYTIKPTSLIVLIAIMISEIINLYCKFSWKLLTTKILSLTSIIAAVPFIFLISLYFRNVIGIDIIKEEKFTYLHYFMVGLNQDTDGIFSNQDVEYSASFNTINERNEGNLKMIKQRIANFGILGYSAFLGKKTLVNFADGSFTWNREGNFFYQIPERNDKISELFRNIYYPDGKYYIIWLTAIQLLWFVVLMLIVFICLTYKSPDERIIAVMLTLIGIIIFVMIFEARARYLFSYTPFFTIGAGVGLKKLRENRYILMKFFNHNKK